MIGLAVSLQRVELQGRFDPLSDFLNRPNGEIVHDSQIKCSSIVDKGIRTSRKGWEGAREV